ncbi:MAG: hypothetical protein KGI33_09125 [Thaumarchaeota archaeon]|nr:hypothetical protein [Nitrososphaerota archaeon]
MRNRNLPIIAISLLAIGLGIMLEGDFHASYVHPLDEARGMLSHIQATSNLAEIHGELVEIKRLLPASGNPVLINPTGETDFGLMQSDLESMLGTVNSISSVSEQSQNFHTGMLNIHAQSTTITFNLLDATPYMYMNLQFVLANAMWLLGVNGVIQYAGTKRK